MHHAIRFARAAALAGGLGAACLPGAALAQAGDPQAAVPATIYRPAITYRPAAEPETPPDRNWVEGNATVAAYNAMSLTMKMKGMHAHGAAAPAAPAPVAQPAQSPQPAEAAEEADPHAAHAGHAGHAQHAAGAATVPPRHAPPAKEAP